jgi:tetratricopeptide (TPR) repeat protein
MPRQWEPNPEYDAAVARFNAGDVAGALPLLQAARAAQPDRARIHSNLAVALRRLERHEEARAAAERGRDLADADDPYPATVLAETLYHLDDNAGAVAAADAALGCPGGATADRVRALAARAWILVRLDRARAAVSDARAAVALDGEHAGAALALAVALATANRWGEAMRAVERAQALDPGDADVLARRATIAQGLEVAERAVAEARAEARAKPKDWERWLALGTCLTMAGHLEEAARAFDRAHDHNPDQDDHWPDEPHLLSPWEADCRLALLEQEATAGPAARRLAVKPRTPRTPRRPPPRRQTRNAVARAKPRKAIKPRRRK